MKKNFKILFFLVLCSFTVSLTFNPAAAADLGSLNNSLGSGEVQNEFGVGSASVAQGTLSITIKKDDKALVEKLKKLLAQIKKEDPNIDSLPVELKAAPFAATDEASLQKFAQIKRRHSYVASFKKAHEEFESGKYEVAFKSFKNIYTEYHQNPKALCFMTLCRSVQAKFKDAVELATELLDIVKRRNQVKKLKESLRKELEAFDKETAETKLTKKQLEEFTKKIDGAMKKVNTMYPSIANIPKAVKKPKMEKNAITNILNYIDYTSTMSRLSKMHTAEKAYEKGEYQKAYDAFSAVYEKNPGSLRSLYYMALCKMRLGEADEAAKITEKLVGIISDNQEIKKSHNDIKDELGIKDKTDDDKDKKPAPVPQG